MLSTLVNSPSVGQDYLSSPEKQRFDDENEKPENVIKAVAAGNFEHHANANYRAMDDLWEVLVNKVFSNEEILNCLLRFLPDKELRRFSQTNSKIYCVSQPIISTLEELTLTLEKFDDFSCLKDLFQALQDDRKIEFITIHAGKKAYFFDSSTKRDLDSYCEILNDPETYHSITIAKQKLKDLGEWASNVFDSFK